MTLLELCDHLQEVLVDEGMQDLPIYLCDERGALVRLREDFISVKPVESGFQDKYDALVIQT